MKRPALEIADIFASLGSTFHPPTLEQRRVFQALLQCRTAALGGHLEQCNQCGHQQIAYNSCRNRHCPKCQATARSEWLERQAQDLLPVPYFHLVFTVPDQLHSLALQNRRCFYQLLFRAASETLLEIAADPRHLGAQIGFLAVLHTWGQTLQFHPHLHCVVPGGGLALAGTHWVPSRGGFFLPVRVLSRLFRRKFLAALQASYEARQLQLPDSFASWRTPAQFAAWLSPYRRQEWVVYAKPPFGGPLQVLKYLARYTHRVAISNHRLVKCEDGQVTFRYKDYADGNQAKQMTLTAAEFTRRFLLHVLPRGFVRIRHYGLLANRQRQSKLARCRQLLQSLVPPESNASLPTVERGEPAKREPIRCPNCQQGTMRVVEQFTARALRAPLPGPATPEPPMEDE